MIATNGHHGLSMQRSYYRELYSCWLPCGQLPLQVIQVYRDLNYNEMFRISG